MERVRHLTHPLPRGVPLLLGRNGGDVVIVTPADAPPWQVSRALRLLRARGALTAGEHRAARRRLGLPEEEDGVPG